MLVPGASPKVPSSNLCSSDLKASPAPLMLLPLWVRGILSIYLSSSDFVPLGDLLLLVTSVSLGSTGSLIFGLWQSLPRIHANSFGEVRGPWSQAAGPFRTCLMCCRPRACLALKTAAELPAQDDEQPSRCHPPFKQRTASETIDGSTATALPFSGFLQRSTLSRPISGECSVLASCRPRAAQQWERPCTSLPAPAPAKVCKENCFPLLGCFSKGVCRLLIGGR